MTLIGWPAGNRSGAIGPGFHAGAVGVILFREVSEVLNETDILLAVDDCEPASVRIHRSLADPVEIVDAQHLAAGQNFEAWVTRVTVWVVVALRILAMGIERDVHEQVGVRS